jgi:hypothetical protein
MIDWNSILTKPAVNTDDKFDAEHKISKKVVVRVADVTGKVSGYSFARYHYEYDHWNIENFKGGDFKVTHWSGLNEPLI